MLTRNAKDMADILGELALKNQAQIQWNPQTKRYSLFFEEGFIPESMNAAILVMASASNSDVRIISPAGQVLLFATANDKMDPDEMLYKAIPADVAQKSLAGSSYTVGRLGDNYTETYYTAGEPIKAGEVGVIGAVLLSTPTGDLSGYIGDNLRMFLLAAVLVLILSFLATYALTYQMAKPLRQMVQAARKFGEGDFSAKIPVNNQDEVAELAVALNNMASSLASVEGMRRSFVANVSHELRTPMTTIGGFIDGILDGTIPEEKQEQYLRTVSDEIKRLSRLVRSMLDISRMEAGELKINPSLFSLSDMVMRVFFSCEKLINDKNIEVRGLEDLPEIHVRRIPTGFIRLSLIWWTMPSNLPTKAAISPSPSGKKMAGCTLPSATAVRESPGPTWGKSSSGFIKRTNPVALIKKAWAWGCSSCVCLCSCMEGTLPPAAWKVNTQNLSSGFRP